MGRGERPSAVPIRGGIPPRSPSDEGELLTLVAVIDGRGFLLLFPIIEFKIVHPK